MIDEGSGDRSREFARPGRVGVNANSSSGYTPWL